MPIEPTDPTPPGPASVVAPFLSPGARVGRYEIIELIGAGGMGEVFRARDLDLGRPAAIKVLRSDLVGRRTDSILREAQATAKMQHPNVVVVYEVGTIERGIFLAMEYVEGPTLRAWLAQQKRTWRELLPVFIAAARGLAAAHRAGIVHRDFKPDNVLVGDDGRVRVADFGLAGESVSSVSSESLSFEDTERFTEALAGTPAYMSPEHFRHDPLDARCDQFAFSISLFEALYGQRPFVGRDVRALRTRILEEAPSPPPPDSSVPAWLHRAVLRGLARDRDARFSSMDAMAAALEADPAPRRRRFLFAGALVACAGVAAFALTRSPTSPSCSDGRARLAGIWDDGVRAHVKAAFDATGRGYAADSFTRVAAGLDEYAGSWAGMHDEACAASVIRHEQSAALFDLRMECLERRKGAFRAVTTLLGDRVDDPLLARSLRVVRSLDSLDACADRAQLTATQPLPADPVLRARIAALRPQLDYVSSLITGGRFRPAALLAPPLAEEARSLPYAPIQVQGLDVLAGSLRGGRNPREYEVRRQIIQLASRAHDDQQVAREWIVLLDSNEKDIEAVRLSAEAAVSRADDRPELRGALLANLAAGRFHAGDLDGAVQAGEQAIAVLEPLTTTLAKESLSSVLTTLGSVRRHQGKPDDEIAYDQRALDLNVRLDGAQHPNVGGALANLANAYMDRGEYDRADELLRRALVLWEEAQGPEGPDVALVARNLGDLEVQRGRADESLVFCQRALAIRLKVFGDAHPATASAFTCVGWAQFTRGHLDEAAEALAHALAIVEKAGGPEHPQVAKNLTMLASVDLGRKKPEDARAECDRALAIDEKKGIGGSDLAEVLEARANALAALGKIVAAKADDVHALDVRRAAAPDDPELASTLTDLADRELALGQVEDALEQLRAAEIIERAHETPASVVASTHFVQARALWATARRSEARVLASSAEKEFAKLGKGGETEEANVTRWLAAHR